jgi:hypothetical protein
VNLSLNNPKLVASGSSTVFTNATVIGNPEYMRISGNGTLKVKMAGNYDTLIGPLVWEVNYGQ